MAEAPRSAPPTTADGCIAILLIIPMVLLWGAVLSDLWRWFPVRLFGVSPIGTWDMAGLLTIHSYFINGRTSSVNPKAAALTRMGTALITWGIGWFLYTKAL
jgi:hypothetical protein